MSHPEVHASSSARKFGGKPEDYLYLHEWFDETKAWLPDMRHRAFRHHAEGIFELEKIFGSSFINSAGKKVFTRYVGEQHVIEDLGFIPTAKDYMENMEMQAWMMNNDKDLKDKLKGNSNKIGTKKPQSLSL